MGSVVDKPPSGQFRGDGVELRRRESEFSLQFPFRHWLVCAVDLVPFPQFLHCPFDFRVELGFGGVFGSEKERAADLVIVERDGPVGVRRQDDRLLVAFGT